VRTFLLLCAVLFCRVSSLLLLGNMGLPSPQGRGNPFSKLKLDISTLLGRNGIDSAEVNPKDILDLMEAYHSNELDWSYYVQTWEENGQPYVRNLVDSGNGNYNLLLLVWRPNFGSCIHDHTKHCCMKILKGQLRETRYNLPEDSTTGCDSKAPLTIQTERILNENQVGYINSESTLESSLAFKRH
jgi:cysteine dioxygenase